MRRWLLITLAGVVIITSTLVVVHLRSTPGPPALPSVRIQLTRTPNSAYKYHLCAEAYAYLLASPENPYKTDFSFQDPFRNVQDTIIPRFIALNARDSSASFSVQVILRHVATLNATIINVHELDGISVQLPNRENQLQHSSVPQFIISAIVGHGAMAVIDYTCPEQWKWSAATPLHI